MGVQEELLALGIQQRRLHELHASVAYRQNVIIEKLTALKMNAALITDLAAEHDRRAAKLS